MVSPARQQYLDLKRKHEDAILLYRLGDFYEMFDSDAEIASKLLGLQLTARNYPRGEGRVPMAGVPHHAVFGYIKRLLEAGHRVALCEQMSEAGKGLVDRDIVRVFTPGTLIEPEMLEAGRNTYLAAVGTTKAALGLAFVDVSTGEFNATEFDGADMIPKLEAELLRISPAECLFPVDAQVEVELPATTSLGPARPNIDGRAAENRLRQHLKVGSLAGFGFDGKPAATIAAAMTLEYLSDTNPPVLALIDAVMTYSADTFMLLDRYTRSSLELLPAAGDGTRRWTLLRVLDYTKTGMGARLLRVTIGRPLLDIGEIDSRLDMVETLVRVPMAVRSLGSTLSGIGDLERIAGRVAHGKSGASDLVQLRQSLLKSIAISDALSPDLPELAGVLARIDGCPEICDAIDAAIGMGAETDIKTGYSSELDGFRATADGAREAIAALEKDEIRASGIKSLRIGYNKVFGYYIEVGKAAAGTVPAHYVRQQTLLNSERYFTPEIKELESRILSARDDAARLEKLLLDELIERVSASHERLMTTAGAIAELDVYRSLAGAAISNGYVRPELNDGLALDIRDGRHPVVEAAVSDTAFVPNDCVFDENKRIIVLMGPNMGGKSTMLRTVALIVLMAQIGSFVPAAAATIGIVDRLFSRVGAQDDISAGQSTFMTEMVETANILHHATPRSLL
ncbi:MAG TPA: DNA mismatch repair protein MutS, partial [Chloroflexota bacterium]|nr:DNA mismatch repair protein MutS [Chloroflexota bacterium]